MKIGQRDVWLPFGNRLWFCFTPLGREWISPEVAGREKGFWLRDLPRRFEIHTRRYSFTLALTPGSRWGGLRYVDGESVHAPVKWIEFSKRLKKF